jgi:hypothetical protein
VLVPQQSEGVLMTLFASPDFGASGMIAFFVLCAWGIAWLLVLVGVITGYRLLQRKSTRARSWAVVLLLLSASLPCCCCFGPDQIVRWKTGRYPLTGYPNGAIEKGMTQDEVLSKIGPPHTRQRVGDHESWYYMLDPYDMYYFGVIFSADGKVTGTHGN